MATRVMGARYTVEHVRTRRDQLVLGAAAVAVLAAIVAFAAVSGVERPRGYETRLFVAPQSYVTIWRTRPGRPTLHERLQRRPDLVVGPYEPVLIAGTTAESFSVAYPNGSLRREIVLGDGLVIELQSPSRRDLDRLEGPAAELLRRLRSG
jgi:hypothetical protein